MSITSYWHVVALIAVAAVTVWAAVVTARSALGWQPKPLWIAGLLFVPIVGLLLWFAIRPDRVGVSPADGSATDQSG